jgi:hypothetical protein
MDVSATRALGGLQTGACRREAAAREKGFRLVVLVVRENGPLRHAKAMCAEKRFD